MNDIIVKYVRNRRGQSIGCVIAKKVDSNNNVYITGSLCHKGKDLFDKGQALTLALDRVDTMATFDRPCRVALSLENEMNIMTERAKRYFKDVTKFVQSDVSMPVM